MLKLDDLINDHFGHAWPDEVEMGRKHSLAGMGGRQAEPPAMELLTVRRAIVNSINRCSPDLPPEKRYMLGELVQRFVRWKHPKLTPTEASVIREMVGKLYMPHIVYQVWEVLDKIEDRPAVELVQNTNPVTLIAG